MASRVTAIKFAEQLLTPKNIAYLKKLISVDLTDAMRAGDVERTSELLDLKKYADALAPKGLTE